MSQTRLNTMYTICRKGGTIDDLSGPITENDKAFWKSVELEVKQPNKKSSTFFSHNQWK